MKSIFHGVLIILPLGQSPMIYRQERQRVGLIANDVDSSLFRLFLTKIWLSYNE
jgi:hypothetical protein